MYISWKTTTIVFFSNWWKQTLQQEVLLSCDRDWHVQIHRQVNFKQDQSKIHHYKFLHTARHTIRQNWVYTYYVFFFFAFVYCMRDFFIYDIFLILWFLSLVLLLVCALLVLSCGLLSCEFVIKWCFWKYVHKCYILYDFHLCEGVLRFSLQM